MIGAPLAVPPVARPLPLGGAAMGAPIERGDAKTDTAIREETSAPAVVDDAEGDGPLLNRRKRGRVVGLPIGGLGVE